jgi:hypothetical protein
MKPYHKFNNGIGATLCNACGRMINEGMTEELYCLDCEVKLFKDGIDEWMKKPKEERDEDVAKLKQEYLNKIRYEAFKQNIMNKVKYGLMAEAWREDNEEEDDNEYSDDNEE